MREPYDENELDSVESLRDTELTLGPTLLVSLFIGLVLLCGLCFGIGYFVGSRSAHASPISQPTVAQPAKAGVGSPAKPAPAPPALPRSQPAANLSASSNTDSQTPVPSTQPTAFESQPLVKPALPVAPAATPSPASTRPASTWTVQIAAVSHQEDADVLVAALRRHGYSVAASRDITDRLIHVRIGPFANRSDAESTEQKLHNDGYNASVQP